MLVRIVKLSFRDEEVDTFLKDFKEHQPKMKGVAGCSLLELYREKAEDNVFFTYSHWNSAQDLENYRNSELFEKIWVRTKVLFSAKPEAWSLEKVSV